MFEGRLNLLLSAKSNGEKWKNHYSKHDAENAVARTYQNQVYGFTATIADTITMYLKEQYLMGKSGGQEKWGLKKR